MRLPLSWDVALALWTLELLDSDQIPDVATLALQRGIDSQQLRVLAGTIPTPGASLRESFSSALQNLGVRLPPRDGATRVLAKCLALQILDRTLDPIDGARKMAEIARAVGGGFSELDAFIYAESEAEDRPDDRQFFHEEIIKAARVWAGRRCD